MADGSMERLIAALEANTAALTKMLATKPSVKSEEPAAKKEEPAKSKADTKPKAKKKTVEDIADAFGGYLGVKDTDERAARKAKVKKIVDHFNVPKATELDPDDYEKALAMLQAYIDGEEPDFGDDNGDGEALV